MPPWTVFVTDRAGNHPVAGAARWGMWGELQARNRAIHLEARGIRAIRYWDMQLLKLWASWLGAVLSFLLTRTGHNSSMCWAEQFSPSPVLLESIVMVVLDTYMLIAYRPAMLKLYPANRRPSELVNKRTPGSSFLSSHVDSWGKLKRQRSLS